MRLFKHGDSLAIVIPEKLRKELSLKENDEFELVSVQGEKAIVLVSKGKLAELLSSSAAGAFERAAISLKEPTSSSPVSAPAVTSPRVPQASGGFTPPAYSKKPFAPVSYSSTPLATSSSSSKSIASDEEVETLPSEQQVMQKGYAVIEEENEAKRISRALEKEIKSGQVSGIRAFDKKFYVVSANYLKEMSPRVTALISSKPLSTPELASQLKVTEKACTALLQVMKESGDVIEKKRGVYQSV